MKAGEIIVEHLHGTKEINYKGRGNIVTQVDRLSEQAIIGKLHSEFPGHGIVSEESSAVEGIEPFTWIVDPLSI